MIKKLKSIIVYENPWMKLHEDEVEFSDKTKSTWTFGEYKHSVIIVPFDGEKFTLVKPFRYAVNNASWEFPAGYVDGDEEHHIAAARELEEEAGLVAHSLEKVCELQEAGSKLNSSFTAFYATDLEKTERKLTEQAELDMELREFTTEQIDEMIQNGEMKESNMVSSYLLVKERFLSTTNS